MRTYVFADRSELPCSDAIGWRTDCESLSEIEQLGSTNAAEERLQGAIRDGEAAEIISMLQHNVEWRKSRRSRPRCLRCYSDDAVILDEITGFEHPKCGGIFESCEASCIHYTTDYVQYLTPQGLPYEIDCLKRVALFVSKFTGLPISSLQAEAFLEQDLGITGAKAIQLITSFGQEFDVELSAFHYLNHFKPVSRLSRFTAPNERDPISLRRMARAVHLGKWV